MNGFPQDDPSRRIDTHIHFAADHPDAVALLDELNLKLLNICVGHDTSGRWREERAAPYRRHAAQDPPHFAWCTAFDPPGFGDPDYTDRVIAGLARDFAAGAVACKFWKNIGMEIRKPDGSFLMIDDPLFTPIYNYLATEDKTALMHIAEPLACWQPLDPTNAHYDYYSQCPEWHMLNRPEMPSHQALMDARDRVLERHPDLRVVGAHLGSLEYDVAEVAHRLDRYPNFAVDTSARLNDLALQDATVVRDIFQAYPDRILFGTDIVQRQSIAGMDPASRKNRLDAIRDRYMQEFVYFETSGTLTLRGKPVQGLGLPVAVLNKFYADNARAWYPGIDCRA